MRRRRGIGCAAPQTRLTYGRRQAAWPRKSPRTSSSDCSEDFLSCLLAYGECGEEKPAISASQRARWRAGRGVRQRNEPLPTVYNCARSIVANGLYPHTPDHHGARPSTSARLPCATLGKSLTPPRVLWAGRDRSPSSIILSRSRNILI
jgi:hypothetical protein